LHFDLFAAAASHLLARSEALRRIICDAYPVIVLDEFQDTNAAEWRFISTLGKSSRLIAFADAQQRSYEFRGAVIHAASASSSAPSIRTHSISLVNHRSDGTCGAGPFLAGLLALLCAARRAVRASSDQAAEFGGLKGWKCRSNCRNCGACEWL
jgi:hypothetical protein